MALGSSPAEVQHHSTRQQEKTSNNTAVSKSRLPGDNPQKQSEHEGPHNKPPASKRKRDMGTDTAYAENTDAMVSEVKSSACPIPHPTNPSLTTSTTQEVTYTLASNHALDPLYNATQLAPVLATLATHKSSLPRPTTTRTKRQPAPPPPPQSETNPFALPPLLSPNLAPRPHLPLQPNLLLHHSARKFPFARRPETRAGRAFCCALFGENTGNRAGTGGSEGVVAGVSSESG
jgi:hypothetical protein